MHQSSLYLNDLVLRIFREGAHSVWINGVIYAEVLGGWSPIYTFQKHYQPDSPSLALY
jgi:hypothetical protein